MWFIPAMRELYPWVVETDVPRAILDAAVKDACTTVLAAIKKYKRGGGFSKLHYKSRKKIQQTMPLRNDKWSKDRRGFCVRALGRIIFHEPLPENLRDGHITRYGESYYVCLPMTEKQVGAENQGRLVALDPGVRTFMTFFSDSSAGFIGKEVAERIARLAEHLDDLISRRSKAGGRNRKALTKAINRLRERMQFLIDELHWKTARFLVENFDVILLPSFEVSGMVIKTKRKIRSKVVRKMLSLKHYLFSQRLEHKAFEMGKKVVRVCEAYTSKTASWTGEIVAIGGNKWIKSGDVVVDRDINGARGIFLRALVDSPTLRGAC
jgi:putative transposase